MWAWGYDQRDGLAVAAFAFENATAEQLRSDLTEASRFFARLDAECHTHPRGPVFLAVVQGESQMPDAMLRRTMAEAARGMRSRLHCTILVAPSRVFRGVLQAITWIVPPPRGHRVIAVDTLEGAHAEAERFRGERLPRLRALAASTLLEVSSGRPARGLR